jgi:hypothetical protein
MKIKIYIIFALCLNSFTILWSQTNVTIAVQAVPEQVFYLEQVANVLLITAPNGQDVSLSAVFSKGNSQQVVSLQTPVFTLESGSLPYFLAADIGYDLSFETNATASFLQDYGFFMQGSYTCCFYLKDLLENVIATTCLEFDVNNYSGPTAILPTQGDTLFSCLPVFSWLPILPTIPDVTYSFSLFEISDSLADPLAVINTMVPDFATSTPNSTVILYPAAYQLNNDIPYVWQVKAVLGTEIIGMTEPISFVQHCALPEAIDSVDLVSIIGYLEPQPNVGDSYVETHISDTLHIVFYNTGNAKFLIYDLEYVDENDINQIMDYNQLPVFELRRGPNLIDIPLIAYDEILEIGGFFNMKITDANGNLQIRYKLLDE